MDRNEQLCRPQLQDESPTPEPAPKTVEAFGRLLATSNLLVRRQENRNRQSKHPVFGLVHRRTLLRRLRESQHGHRLAQLPRTSATSPPRDFQRARNKSENPKPQIERESVAS